MIRSVDPQQTGRLALGLALLCAIGSPAPSTGAATGAAQSGLTTELLVSGLVEPVKVTAPQGDPRLFIVERIGRIRIFEGGSLLPQPFLDIRSLVLAGGERGLLGLAFAPDYASNGLFYVNYTDLDGDTIIARYRVGGAPNVADPSTAEILLEINQPFGNHNGGDLAFGPEGYLYIAMGDGGSGGDPANRAQDLSTMLGKVLRIDVSGGLGSGYTVPRWNPFIGSGPPLDEIWAYGLRNPYRFSFDRVTGDLYIADVGQDSWEEVNAEPADHPGAINYGWRRMEGRYCYNPSSGCNDGTLTLPVLEYGHDGSRCAVTGGYAYRGSIPYIQGHYFFADYCSGEVFSFLWDGGGGVLQFANRTAGLAPPGGFEDITGFGEDGFGELYLVQFGGGNGAVYKIVDLGPGLPSAPTGLSSTVNGSTVVLAWNAPAPGGLPDSYVIEAGSAPGAVDLAMFDTGSTATSLQVDAVPDGVYHVRVRARNAVGTGPPSGEVQVVVGACVGPPQPPSGLAAGVDGSTVILSWSAPAGGSPPSSYVIEAGSFPGAADLAVYDTGNTQTSIVVPGVPSGVYHVRIRARNGCGVSGPTSDVVVIV